MQPASPSYEYVVVIKGAKEVYEGKAGEISGLNKIDDLTFEVTLNDPVDLKFYLWLPGAAILPKEEVEGKGDAFSTNPVGCGPFKFKEWVKGSEVVIEKFDGFYKEGLPYLEVEF